MNVCTEQPTQTPTVGIPGSNASSTTRSGPSKPPQRRMGSIKRAALGLIGLPAALMTARSAKAFFPQIKQPVSPSWVGGLQQHVNNYAQRLDIDPPTLYVHNSGAFTNNAEMWVLYWPRVIALHADLPNLFSSEQMDCIVAHEVAHFCQAGRSQCALPNHVEPTGFGTFTFARELQADYIGSLLCGKQEMESVLRTLAKHAGDSSLTDTWAEDAAHVVNSTPWKMSSTDGVTSFIEYPSFARRIEVVQKSNETHYAGPQPSDEASKNMFVDGLKISGKRFAPLVVICGAYQLAKFFSGDSVQPKSADSTLMLSQN